MLHRSFARQPSKKSIENIQNEISQFVKTFGKVPPRAGPFSFSFSLCEISPSAFWLDPRPTFSRHLDTCGVCSPPRGSRGSRPGPVFLKQTHPLIIDPGYIITGRSVIAAGNWKRPVCCFFKGNWPSAVPQDGENAAAPGKASAKRRPKSPYAQSAWEEVFCACISVECTHKKLWNRILKQCLFFTQHLSSQPVASAITQAKLKQ